MKSAPFPVCFAIFNPPNLKQQSMVNTRPQPSVPISLRISVLVVIAVRKDPVTWNTDFSGGLTGCGYSVQPHSDDESWNNSPTHHHITSNLDISGIDWRSGFWEQDLHFMFLSKSDYEYLYGEGSWDMYLRTNGYIRDYSNHKKKYTEEYGESEWDGFASNANWLSGVNLVAGPDFQNEIDGSLAQLKAKLDANGGGESQGFFSDGVWTLSLTGTASGGIIGVSGEIGITLDFRNGFQIGAYTTIEHALGADWTAGAVLNYHKPVANTSNFGVSDLNGWSEKYNGGFLIFDGTYGGNATNQGLDPNNYSDYHSIYNTYGLGMSIGSPVGFTRNKGYTWTSPTIGW